MKAPPKRARLVGVKIREGDMMIPKNRRNDRSAKVAAREIPVGLIILGVGAVYLALCLKVLAGG